MTGSDLADISLRLHEQYMARFGLGETTLERLEIYFQRDRVLAWRNEDGMEWHKMLVVPYAAVTE
jgi:hypothetical protein